jgi:hypothetical protein
MAGKKGGPGPQAEVTQNNRDPQAQLTPADP